MLHAGIQPAGYLQTVVTSVIIRPREMTQQGELFMKPLLIRKIKDFEECRAFVAELQGDPVFSEPMLANEEQLKSNLVKAIEKPEDYCILGIFRDGEMAGLFSFLALETERYLEMLVGLSRDADVYDAVFAYLRQHYTSWDADFVFNPNNYLLQACLQKECAEFETEQQKMVFAGPLPAVDTAGVELLSEHHKKPYFAMHSTDMYWTGEKVVAAPDRFRTLVAVENGALVGYIDVTVGFEENEPFDLLVLPEFRRRGYGRKLLAKALEMNRPKGMVLQVNVDNFAAIHLYESLGFEKAQNCNSLTVHWKVPAC